MVTTTQPTLVDKLIDAHYKDAGDADKYDAYRRAAYAYCFGDKKLAERIYQDVCNKHAMFSSPVLSNAPVIEWPDGNYTFAEAADWLSMQLPTIKLRGLPISCFLQYMGDSKDDIVSTWAETAYLTYAGGGVGIHCKLRGNHGKATGAVANLHVTDAQMLACIQGTVRRGSAAAYLDVSHPEIIEFIEMRVPAGSANRKNLNMHHAVNLTDSFMQAVYDDKEWVLWDGIEGSPKETVRARTLWELLLETRFRTGEPYLNFIDTANDALPETQKKAGLKIHGSNLCNEIHLPTSSGRTAVCCLSSLNLEFFDEWRPGMVEDWTRFLDNVLEFFIRAADGKLGSAVYSAFCERALGLGTMGYHSYFQRKGIPFESALAVSATRKIYSSIKKDAERESRRMAEERGSPPDMQGTGLRNSQLTAIAPNANSALLLGTSPSAEPWSSNCFVQQTRAGSTVFRNPYLHSIIESRVGFDSKEVDRVWYDIAKNDGSIQHMEDFFTDWERQVFKTAYEIDQMFVVELAAHRQEFITQGQSVNVFFGTGANRSYVRKVHEHAHKRKLKGLYYLRTQRMAKAENIGTLVSRVKLENGGEDECIACQG